LLEVLIALIVLSLGALGLAGLQALSLQLSRSANQQAQAVQLAREYSELLRNNPAVASLSQGNPYLLAASDTVTGQATQDCSRSHCSANQLAHWEAYEWQNRVFNTLPSARLAVCFDVQPYDANGQAQWTCTDHGAADAAIAIKLGWRQPSTNPSVSGLQAASLRPSLVHLVWPAGQRS
jgi:type IV pilus assembly protein PilV